MPRTQATIQTLAALLLCVAGNAQEKAKSKLGSVTAIQIASLDQLTRVTIAVNGVIDIKSDRIENPSRVFIDFRDTVPMLSGKSDRTIQTVSTNDKLLKQIRVAENQKGVTRLVFDLLRSDIEYRTIVAKDPNRLVVELRSAHKESGLRNPLADAPPPVPTVLARNVATPYRGGFRMPDPPLLSTAAFRLPRVETSQLPYRVTGIQTLELKGAMPAKTASRPISPAIAATRTSSGKQSLTRVLGLKIGKVVIDAGHGGHDVGSIGITGLLEKDVVLDVAKRLGTLIEDGLGSEVIYTRKDDTFIVLDQRPIIANQNHADLFISIHANSSPAKAATGVETYYLNFTSSPEALEVAARENASSGRGVSDLGDLIKKIALKEKIDESREFASKVQSSLQAGSAKAGIVSKDRGVRKAPFIVLIGAQMPSVLSEIGFLSNPKEEALLRKPEYRQKIAESIYRGLSQYAGTLSHFTVAQNAGQH
ncbi:N-acetylmuramoyl-L-alanine amidase [Bryobacter aggregatus]|uniref:N-acetylmuramoyl-L-alanine amidase n=1 Tax=Bryobacter aggregatus TaxID=360054 RepID=UPI00068CB84F|nr:N-acetylmuramoyl-L-alanine amidase [Bryobacter aggregatus]